MAGYRLASSVGVGFLSSLGIPFSLSLCGSLFASSGVNKVPGVFEQVLGIGHCDCGVERLC